MTWASDILFISGWTLLINLTSLSICLIISLLLHNKLITLATSDQSLSYHTDKEREKQRKGVIQINLKVTDATRHHPSSLTHHVVCCFLIWVLGHPVKTDSMAMTKTQAHVKWFAHIWHDQILVCTVLTHISTSSKCTPALTHELILSRRNYRVTSHPHVQTLSWTDSPVNYKPHHTDRFNH